MESVPPTASASDNVEASSKQPRETKIESVEDKLEDRYNKLKLIAVKLKKRVAEQAQEIDGLEQVKIRLTEKNQTAVRSLTTVQQEFDKAQDEIERLKKSESCLQKDLKGAMDANIKLKEADFEKNNQIQALTATSKILREKVERADKFEEELTIWKSRCMELDNELKGVKQNEKEALQEKRQTAMLSLEITDYEKKLQTAYELLDQSKAEAQAQVSQVERHEVTIKLLGEKIDNLQSNVEQLTNTNDNLQIDLQRKAEKITFLQEEVAKVNEKFQQKKSEMLRVQTEYENCKLNFACESKLLVEKNSMLQKTVTMLEHKISALEENKRSRESQISNLKLELHQLDTDYRNYKVKAQAMLKSQKPTHLSLSSQDNDELENLQKIVQDFHSEISLLKSDLQTVKLENENLTMEKADLNLKLKQIKTELIEKEVRLSSESQKLRTDLRLKELEMKKNWEDRQAEHDLISSTFREQTESLKQGYEAKIKSLKEQLEMCKIGVGPGDYAINDSSKPSPSSDSEFVVAGSKNDAQGFRPIVRESPFGCNDSLDRLQQPLIIDTSNSGISFDQLRMMPRGECEGSESVSSAAYLPRADNYNVSFEQLLNSSFDSVSKVSSDSETAAAQRPPDLTSAMIKEELVRCQNQVRHLTALLRESESNLLTMTQLSEALKEEIRRVERDQERKEHLQENSEYLKNVLLKFITLHGVDERIRLIPVFKTMLKLSPEEVARLEAAVKGGENQSEGNGSKGWSAYLQKWTT